MPYQRTCASDKKREIVLYFVMEVQKKRRLIKYSLVNKFQYKLD